MEQIDVMTQFEKLLGSSTYHVWILDSYNEWVLISGKPLSENGDMFLRYAAWSETSFFNESYSYRTYYDSTTLTQLFMFDTEEPESIAVRACIQSHRQLSELECDHVVLQIRHLLFHRTLNRQRQEHNALLQGLHSLTSLLDLNELLHNIMRNALAVIPAIDRGFLTLFDPETHKLVPKASIGMGISIYDFKTDIGEGIAGKVFKEGVGCIYNQEQAIEAISDLREYNFNNLMNAINSSETNENLTLMAVPVRMNKENLGVMVVHQIKKKRRLSTNDLRRLQGFANQAAIAISNARLFSELRETNDFLVKRNHIHEVFTKLFLKDNDLEMVAKTVEQMISLPVALFDLTKNEWYPHSSPIPSLLKGTQLPNWENCFDPFTVVDASGASFHLYPIVNEGIPIGYFVLELRRPLEQLDTVVLEQGGALVALKMVNTYSMTDMHYKQSYEFFNELLQYKEPNLLAAKSMDSGLSPEKPIFVTVLQLTEKSLDVKKREAHIRRLIASLKKELGYLDNLLFGFHDKITIITHATNESIQESIIEKLKTGINMWKNNGSPRLLGGIGRLYKGLEYVAKSSEEANKSLSYLLNRGIPGILRYENIGINRLFLKQQTKDIEQFIQEVLSPLKSPKALASDLELTLKTYIAANRSTSITADRLHIHPNTLYHRIKKIEEALAVDLNDPNDWLTLLLACHLSETY